MATVDPRRIFAYLTERGVSPAAAAGILANIQYESSFNPKAVGDNGTSGGLFQHHKGRWDNLRNYASRTGRSWDDWTAQVDFALSEARSMGIDLQNPDAADASKEWTLRFERPANASKKAVIRARAVGKYRYDEGAGPSTGEAEAAGGQQYRIRGGGLRTQGLWQLPDFMAALREAASGSPQGQYRTAGGAYGITPENWRRWTRELGIWGAPISSRAAQDFVARHKLSEYYTKYGDWRLVAAAWWGGTSAVAQAETDGLASSAFASDIARLASSMGLDAPYNPLNTPRVAREIGPPSVSAPETELTRARRSAGIAPQPGREAVLAASELHPKIAGILQGLSNAIRRGPFATPEPLETTETTDQGGPQ